MDKQWFINYDLWQGKAKNEALNKLSKCPFASVSSPDDIEICETGQVRVKGSMIITEANFVTSWENSIYYMP